MSYFETDLLSYSIYYYLSMIAEMAAFLISSIFAINY